MLGVLERWVLRMGEQAAVVGGVKGLPAPETTSPTCFLAAPKGRAGEDAGLRPSPVGDGHRGGC